LHAFDDVIFDPNQKDNTPEFHPSWSRSKSVARGSSMSPSSVSSEGFRSSQQSVSPDVDPNYYLRKRIEDLVLTNHLYMERLRQQDRFIHQLIEADLGRPDLGRSSDMGRLPRPKLHELDRYDSFLDYDQEPTSSYRPWLDERFDDYADDSSYRPPYSDPHSDLKSGTPLKHKVGQRMAALIPNARAKIIPALRHMGLAENPQAFNSQLVSFFQEELKRTNEFKKKDPK
jgi:pimeloyl-ACP methyl ester carboxylesterase